MKKEYTKPVAKKAVFNYEKVVAQSGETCIWHQTDVGRGCHTTEQVDNSVMLAAIPECGWLVERT